MGISRIAAGAVITALIAFLSGQTVQARQTYVNNEIIDLCDKYGAEYDIDKYFLIAVVECESSGNPNAVSYNGQYIGLMQLNKDTFSGDLTNADNNVMQGAKYIDTLRSRNEGNAIKAYSYYCGEAGRTGFYTRKVINHYFELYCEGILGKQEKTL